MDIRQSALMIRDAVDRWEVDGDDERLVNDVIDPWILSVLAATDPAVLVQGGDE